MFSVEGEYFHFLCCESGTYSWHTGGDSFGEFGHSSHHSPVEEGDLNSEGVGLHFSV